MKFDRSLSLLTFTAAMAATGPALAHVGDAHGGVATGILHPPPTWNPSTKRAHTPSTGLWGWHRHEGTQKAFAQN